MFQTGHIVILGICIQQYGFFLENTKGLLTLKDLESLHPYVSSVVIGTFALLCFFCLLDEPEFNH
jgi:hypothetical protein